MSKQRSWVSRATAADRSLTSGENRGVDRDGGVGTPEFAPYGRRFVALLIDWIICLMIGVLIGNIRHSPWLPVVILFLLYVIFVSAFMWTPGMLLTGIRCVRFPDAGRLPVTQVAVRAFLLCLFVPALIITDDSGRGWHDKAVSSATILAPRPIRLWRSIRFW